jgi:hypothetical protein
MDMREMRKKLVGTLEMQKDTVKLIKEFTMGSVNKKTVAILRDTEYTTNKLSLYGLNSRYISNFN